MNTSRRNLVATAAAAAAFAALAVLPCAADLDLSLQAYTFRDRSGVETGETAARLGECRAPPTTIR